MKKMFFVIILFLSLSGCGLFSPVPQAPATTYLLNDPIAQNAENVSIPKKSGKILLVSEISSPSWLDTAQMAYQSDNNEVSYFALNKWAAPPADLLQPL